MSKTQSQIDARVQALVPHIESLDVARLKKGKTGEAWIKADLAGKKVNKLKSLVSLAEKIVIFEKHTLDEATIKTLKDSLDSGIKVFNTLATETIKGHFSTKTKGLNSTIISKQAQLSLTLKHGELAHFSSPVELLATNRTERRAIDGFVKTMGEHFVKERYESELFTVVNNRGEELRVAFNRKGKSVTFGCPLAPSEDSTLLIPSSEESKG